MRILILDDHVLVREGLASVVQSLLPAAEIVFAGNCSDALKLGFVQKPNIAFIDLQLPDKPGFVALEQFRSLLPETSVVVVSGTEDNATVMRALDLGARAFLPKSASSEKLRDSLSQLLSGRVVLPSSILSSQAAKLEELKTAKDYAEEIGITTRQFDVLGLVVAGLSNKLIARRLNIAEATVKIHVSAALRALQVTSRTQALIQIARLGIPFQEI